MNKYRVIGGYTGKEFGIIEAKDKPSAKRLAVKKFGNKNFYLYSLDEQKIEDNPRMYPGFAGGAKRPVIPIKKMKVPGGRKHIKDEPGMSTFVKKKYDVTFMLEGRKKKQSVWAKDDAEAIAMIKDLYPKASAPFRKNPRGAGIPIDQTQLDLMIEAYRDREVFADSKKEENAIFKLVQSELMSEISGEDKVFNLTVRGRKLLSEYLKEQEQYT